MTYGRGYHHFPVAQPASHSTVTPAGTGAARVLGTASSGELHADVFTRPVGVSGARLADANGLKRSNGRRASSKPFNSRPHSAVTRILAVAPLSGSRRGLTLRLPQIPA